MINSKNQHKIATHIWQHASTSLGQSTASPFPIYICNYYKQDRILLNKTKTGSSSHDGNRSNWDQNMCTTVITEDLNIPWEVQEVPVDGAKLFDDEKSGEPFMSFICKLRRVWTISSKLRWLVHSDSLATDGVCTKERNICQPPYYSFQLDSTSDVPLSQPSPC